MEIDEHWTSAVDLETLCNATDCFVTSVVLRVCGNSYLIFKVWGVLLCDVTRTTQTAMVARTLHCHDSALGRAL